MSSLSRRIPRADSQSATDLIVASTAKFSKCRQCLMWRNAQASHYRRNDRRSFHGAGHGERPIISEAQPAPFRQRLGVDRVCWSKDSKDGSKDGKDADPRETRRRRRRRRTAPDPKTVAANRMSFREQSAAELRRYLRKKGYPGRRDRAGRGRAHAAGAPSTTSARRAWWLDYVSARDRGPGAVMGKLMQKGVRASTCGGLVSSLPRTAISARPSSSGVSSSGVIGGSTSRMPRPCSALTRAWFAAVFRATPSARA